MTNKKATHKTDRKNVEALTNIINVGPSIAADLKLIGITSPQKLIGKNPVNLYKKLIKETAKFHDPCVLDVFMAAVDFMNGQPPKVWWEFTEHRKNQHTKIVESLRQEYPL